MSSAVYEEARNILNDRFGHDTLIALATVDGTAPCVRAVNAYYEDNCFYVITNAKSRKMKQIAKNPSVAICGDWFTANAIGENLGHICASGNKLLADTLRGAFASWYGNGHIDEQDTDVCILCLRLADGVLMSHGKRYVIDFVNQSAQQ